MKANNHAKGVWLLAFLAKNKRKLSCVVYFSRPKPRYKGDLRHEYYKTLFVKLS